ncbi:MAG: RNA methyltransferase [Candidatus Riflebacteria bacterium]|nr:RNA methyltransferase [Candidatus Riflebacteria bacterium]
MKNISSASNEKIKTVLSLSSSHAAKKHPDLIFLEGEKLVREAINSNLNIEDIFVLEKFKDQWVSFSDRVSVVTPEIMKRISELNSAPPVSGLFSRFGKTHSAENIIQKGKTFVFLDRIQDPGNLGTIIRTADGLNVDGIFLSKGCCSANNQKTIRAAMGSIFHIPIFEISDFSNLKALLEENSVKIIGADISGKCLYGFEFPEKVMFIFGNEGSGIENDLIKDCFEMVSIPIPGKAESYNVSVAASIVLYERNRSHRIQEA